ncbi:hypothetical protein GCM10010411_92130 [Actinomadura fulvescens]|uniref:Uncharacterized protein n=1 Tax=Actinomadura fulvescens TaxID=46160 RepID=A0ABP6D828_9ACTN
MAEQLVTALPAADFGVTAHLLDDRPGFYVLDLPIEGGDDPTKPGIRDRERDALKLRAAEAAREGTGRHVVVVPALYGQNLDELVATATAHYNSGLGWTLRDTKVARDWARYDELRAAIGHLGAGQFTTLGTTPPPEPDDPRPWPDRDEVLTDIPEPQRTAILKMHQLWDDLSSACKAVLRDAPEAEPDRLEATEDFAPALVELDAALQDGAREVVYEAAVRLQASIDADLMDALAAGQLRKPELALFGGVMMMRGTLHSMMEMQAELDAATEKTEAALTAAQDPGAQPSEPPSPQGDPGINDDGTLQPGPDPRADARIDQLAWEAAVKVSNNDKLDLATDTELPLAAAIWRASGRPVDWEAFQHGPDAGNHPVYLLASRRMEIVAARAGRGEPLCPELAELKARNARQRPNG